MTYQKHISKGGADWQDDDFLYASDLNNIETYLFLILKRIEEKSALITELFNSLDLDLTKKEFYSILGYKEKSILRIKEIIWHRGSTFVNLFEFEELNRLPQRKYLSKKAAFQNSLPYWKVFKYFGACLVDDTVFWGGGFSEDFSTTNGEFHRIKLLRNASNHQLPNMPVTGGCFELFKWKDSLFRTPMIHIYSPFRLYDDYFRTFCLRDEKWKDSFASNRDRYRATYVQIDNLLYTFGGHDEYFRSKRDCVCWDLKERTYFQLDDLPSELASGQAVRIDDTIWLVNGWHWDTNLPYKGVFKYDIYDDKWSWVRDFPGNNWGLQNHQMTRFGDQLFIWGGTDGYDFSVFLYDPVANEISSDFKDIKSTFLCKKGNRLFSFAGENTSGLIRSVREINQDFFFPGCVFRDTSQQRDRFPGVFLDRFCYFNHYGQKWKRVNLITRETEELSDLPFSSDRISFLTSGRYIFALGGGNSKVYDTKNDEWFEAAFIALPNLIDYNFFKTGRYAYFIGGSLDHSGIAAGQIDLLAQNASGWNYLTSSFGEPITDIALLRFGGELYGYGGMKYNSGVPCDSIWKFDLNSFDLTEYQNAMSSSVVKHSVPLRRGGFLLGGIKSDLSIDEKIYLLNSPFNLVEVDSFREVSWDLSIPKNITAFHFFNNNLYYLGQKFGWLVIGMIEFNLPSRGISKFYKGVN